MTSSKKARVGYALVVLGVVNFCAYCIVGMMLGGDAFNGHQESGHYFLSSHGTLTEVPHAVYLYSLIHTFTVFVTHPLAMLGYWWMRRGRS